MTLAKEKHKNNRKTKQSHKRETPTIKETEKEQQIDRGQEEGTP